MTIHLALWLAWLLASVGYIGLGLMVWTWWRAMTMDGGMTTIEWVDATITFLVFLIWPVALAFFILWALIGLVLLLAGVD